MAASVSAFTAGTKDAPEMADIVRLIDEYEANQKAKVA